MFRIASVLGLAVCWIINILWVYFLLIIVPQTARPGEDEENTLEYARKHGLISTVPLINIINKKFPSLAWIAYLVNIFIMISITVSFITLGAGLKHMCK